MLLNQGAPTKLSWLYPNSKNLFTWSMAIIMLCGLFVFNWPPETILFTYFFETIIIGFIHIVKLSTTFLFSTSATTKTGKHDRSKIISIPFFAFHYFFFVAIQSVFVFTFFDEHINDIKDSFNILENYAVVLNQPGMWMAVLSIALTKIAMALQNFFIPKRYLTQTVDSLFMQPYLRIFIQQLVTILTGFGFIIFNASVVSAVLLIIIRLMVDLALQHTMRNKEFKNEMIKTINKSNRGKDKKDAEEQLSSFLED